MTVRAAVAGASGYAGGELLRLLLAHPEVEIGALTGRRPTRAAARRRTSRTSRPLADRVLAADHAGGLAGHDVVFLALPHGQSAAVAERARPGRARRRLRRRLPARATPPTGSSFYGSRARRHLALRPARAARARAPRWRGASADRRARLLPDRRHARALSRRYAARPRRAARS